MNVLDDVVTWKHFRNYRPFVSWIYLHPVNFPDEKPVIRSFYVSVVVIIPERLLNKHVLWVGDLRCRMWCCCNGDAILYESLRLYRSVKIHDDVIKWKHFPRHWPFVRGIHRSPVNSPHKGQWRWAFMFSLICARIIDWVNNREAGDLRRRRAHYDVTVMSCSLQICCSETVKWHCGGGRHELGHVSLWVCCNCHRVLVYM